MPALDYGQNLRPPIDLQSVGLAPHPTIPKDPNQRAKTLLDMVTGYADKKMEQENRNA